MPSTEREPLIRDAIPVAVFLSGRRRGQMEKLERETFRVTRGPGAEIRFLSPDDESAREYHATLHRSGATYELEVAPDRNVWVNGKRVEESHMLKSGDLVEIGQSGPVIRYRLYPVGATWRKSITEVFADSADGARADGHSTLGKSTRFLANVTRDLATQTSVWFRIWLFVLLTLLVVSVALLVVQNLRLQKRVAIEGVRIEGLAQMLEKARAQAMTRDELLALRAEVEERLAAATERLEALEAGRGAVARVIEAASPSVVFVQGAFGFTEPKTGKLLRYIETPDGIVLFTLEERGKLVELPFTGTAFVVSADGLLLTNRHVAEPWFDDPRTEIARERGLSPVLQRLIGFMPDVKGALELQLFRTSDQADLALLRIHEGPAGLRALNLNPSTPRPGDEVIVLGYPLGMQALVVRASPEFLKAVTPNGNADFWSLARRLSEAGYIKPLATRGIVSQVSDEVVAYDAETAIGGSGGPVLDLSGRVVAVNAAVLEEFGGSNVGVPALRAQAFLNKAQTPEKSMSVGK